MIDIYKYDEVYFKIECDDEIHNDLYNHVSYFVKDYKYIPSYKSGMWNGKISLYEKRDRLFPIGLLNKLVEFIKMYKYEFKLHFDVNIFKNSINENELDFFLNDIFNRSDKKLRDYQVNAIKESIKSMRGVLLYATGAGKSAIIYSLVRYAISKGLNTIIVVPTQDLVNQLYSDFENDYSWIECNDYVTKLYSGLEPDYNKEVLITTWQSLLKKDKQFFNKYDFAICDEVHRAKAVELRRIFHNISNAKFRIGTTGTLSDNLCDEMTIQSSLGKVLLEVKTKELQDSGYLADIFIKNIIIKYPDNYSHENDDVDYHKEVELTVNNKDRHKVLNNIINRFSENDNAIILVKRVEHIENIKKHLDSTLDKKYKIYITHGKIKAKDREIVRNEIIKGKNCILIATYATCGTGINIPSLNHVVFFSDIESKITVLQSLGRGTRKTSEKSSFILWDIIDKFKRKCTNFNSNTYSNYTTYKNSFSYMHFSTRKKYYKDQGWNYENENIEL